MHALKSARVHDLAGSFVLFVVPLAPEGDTSLTPTELAVAKLAASGRSNRAAAKLRGSSAHTVANQLASVYRKLGISGRRELRARLTEQDDVRAR